MSRVINDSLFYNKGAVYADDSISTVIAYLSIAYEFNSVIFYTYGSQALDIHSHIVKLTDDKYDPDELMREAYCV